MGYTTEFRGVFNLNKELDEETNTFLKKLAATRRMARNIEGYGVEGEFYVDGGNAGGFMDDHSPDVIDYNVPPKTQPGLWCQWVPTEDKMGIEWDEGEKFYNYVEWLEYIIANVLIPKGYVLNGDVEYRGEEWDDRGVLRCKDNVVELCEKENL